jgi:redox-sensitive bicupin YhaK (pirin superfamily)
MNWGALRVFNDDVIRGGGGFGMHPHRDMEIVTYVLEGELEHQDSLGNRGVIHPGEVQVMSAGKGIVHAEYNHSKDKDVHLIQLWILPRNHGGKPRWEQKQFRAADRHDKLLPVVSAGQVSGTLTIDQDARIFVSSLDAGASVKHELASGRKGYLFVMAGALEVNGTSLAAADQGRIADEPLLNIVASKPAEFMLLDLPEMD